MSRPARREPPTTLRLAVHREQLREAVQAQQAAAAAQQEAMQRLQRAQRARDVMVSITRSRTFLHPQTLYALHSSNHRARMPHIPLQSKRTATLLLTHRRQNDRRQSRALVLTPLT